MIGKILCKNYLWIPGIVKQLWKPSKNKSQCGLGLLSVSNRFCYEGKKEKKMATTCRNNEIYLLEVPFVKLKASVKNYHEQGLHLLEL